MQDFPIRKVVHGLVYDEKCATDFWLGARMKDSRHLLYILSHRTFKIKSFISFFEVLPQNTWSVEADFFISNQEIILLV